MSFRDDLEAKIAELKTEGRNRELRFLAAHGVAVVDGELIDGVAPDQPLVAEDARGQQYASFGPWLDDLVSRFESFTDLDTGPINEVAQALGGLELGFAAVSETGTVSSVLRAGEREMDDVRQLVVASEWTGDGASAEWTGNAAAAFYNGFVDPYSTAAGLHIAYTQELNLAVGTIRHTVKSVQDDILAIADATIDALRGGQINRSNLFSSFSTIATVFGFAVAPEIFGGISLVTGFTSLFLAARDSDVEPAEWTVDTSEARVDSANPIVILESAWNVISRLREIIADDDADIAGTLSDDRYSTEGFANPDLELSRPQLANEPGALGTSTIPPGPAPGVPLSQDALVVALVKLHEAGARTLPLIAAYTNQAVKNLDDSSMPEWLRNYLPGSVAEFHVCRNHLTTILASISRSLEDTAVNLIDTAITYSLTDEETAERTRQIDAATIPGLPF